MADVSVTLESRSRRVFAASAQWAPRLIFGLIGVLLVSMAAIYVALLVAPKQSVSAVGQPVEIGAVTPTLNLSGPAGLSIDGHDVQTSVHFPGPVRPHVDVSRDTINGLIVQAETSSDHLAPITKLGNELADGWKRYLLGEVTTVVVAALVITGTVIGWWTMIRNRRGRHFWRKRVAAFVLCTLSAVALNSVGLTQMSQAVAQVRSLSDLFASGPAPYVAPVGPKLPGVQAVVIGDSTAAGQGNPLVSNPSDQDKVCQRSGDSYAASLATATGWNVLNLACSGATIDNGLIDGQDAAGQVLPPQLAIVKQATDAKYVFVSVGANDLWMGTLVGVCAGLKECSDQAQNALFRSELDSFTQSYGLLLKELKELPGKPLVVINLYYDGLGNGTCANKLLDDGSVAVLRSWFDAMNQRLSDGAQLYGFAVAQPNFAGHGICDPQPYVQGFSAKAPLHPTLDGGLSIALADLHAVNQAERGT